MSSAITSLKGSDQYKSDDMYKKNVDKLEQDMQVSEIHLDEVATRIKNIGSDAQMLFNDPTKAVNFGLDFKKKAQSVGSLTLPTEVPKGNVVDLGNSLKALGLNVSEHPDFGGVTAGVHKGSGHAEGRALDINIPKSGVEANNAAHSSYFDNLAEQLKSAGYKVLWKTAGHFNHIHVEIP